MAVGALSGLVLTVASGRGDKLVGGADTGDFPAGSVPAPRVTELRAAAKAAGCTLKSGKSEGQDHVAGGVAYRSNPPHSSNHDQIPVEDGAYPAAQPTERLVHALEHGRIVVQFKPSAPDELRGSLRALFDENPYHVVLGPNSTRMPFAVAATAWTKVLGCPRPGPPVFDAVRAFRDRYRDRGPEDVP